MSRECSSGEPSCASLSTQAGKGTAGGLSRRGLCNAILVYKGKVLAQNLKLYIKLPGGGVDPGESPKQALIREVIEETGAKL